MQAVELEVFRLEAGPRALGIMLSWLSGDEQRRFKRLKFGRDRRRFAVARARLRELLGARLGCRADEVKLGLGAHGKPMVLDAPELCFSLSHCDDLALVAFARAREVGVDLEALRPLPEADAIAARLLSPDEQRAYAGLGPAERMAALCGAWTRKEAYAKALGSGIGSVMDAPAAEDWNVENFSPRIGYIAAVAWPREAQCVPS